MTEIKTSINKLKAATKLLETISSKYDSEIDMQSLKDPLTEINDSVEDLKTEVNTTENSPIRYNK